MAAHLVLIWEKGHFKRTAAPAGSNCILQYANRDKSYDAYKIVKIILSDLIVEKV